MSKIYLASPFFNDSQRKEVERIAKKLREKGHWVYVPMEHKIPNGEILPNSSWAREVFKSDCEAIKEADEIFAIIYGMDDDAGTAWEIGYGIGTGKIVKVILAGGLECTYSLMILNSVYGVYDSFLNKVKNLPNMS